MLGSLPSFDRLVAELSKLPGVGGKTAARLAFHLLRAPQADTDALADALRDMKQKVAFCSRCFHITETDPCAICQDPSRDGRLCIVQEPQDLLAIERSHAFRGRYHVLHGALSPLDGVGPEDLKIAPLLERLRNEEVEEILLATNFTVEGEATALYLARLLKPLGMKITRLAHGIPMGSDLEYIDTATVQQAVDSRRDF
ncbi:MAG: recombination mediator RecR [Desulfuromonadales bacterium]|nr:recombination mediator RecR [Desulfuromonadales bacterium]